MKKREVVKLVGKTAQMRLDLRTKARQAEKLIAEVELLEGKLFHLSGVTLHQGVPIRVIMNYSGGFMVSGACDEYKRWAFANKIPGRPGFFTINYYKGDETSVDGSAGDGPHSRGLCTKMMKEWVVNGKRGGIPVRSKKVRR